MQKIKNEKLFSILPTVIVGILLVASILTSGFNFKKEVEEPRVALLSAEEAGQKAVEYINENILLGQATAFLKNIVDFKADGFCELYKFQVDVNGQTFDSYITRDGKLIFPEAIDLGEASIVQTPEAEAPKAPSEDTISSEELTKFINCLKEVNFIIYGANWCGWTKKLVEMLGGFDMVKSIYVECTEEEKLCEEKEISAYPTILIKGERYEGGRTFENLSAATGCQIPPGAESISGENSGGGGCQ